MKEEKVRFRQVMSEGYSIYKDNFKLLFMFAIISGCFTLTTTILDSIRDRLDIAGVSIIISLFSFGISIISIYYLGRLAIGMYLAIANIYHNREVTFTEMYDKGQPLFWSYFGTRLVAGLMFIIPMVVIIIGSVLLYMNLRVTSPYTDYNLGASTVLLIIGVVMIIVGAIGVIFLFYKLSMLTSIIILDTKEKSQINKSFKLSKANASLIIPLIIVMIFPYLIILGLDTGIKSLIGANFASSTIISIIATISMALLQPLFAANFVVIFFNLSETSDFEEVETIETNKLVAE